jgi:hypothetical protein
VATTQSIREPGEPTDSPVKVTESSVALRLGLASFVMLNLWLVLITGFSFVEVFILPRLATADPRFVVGWMGMLTGSASELHLGVLATLWTLTAPLYMLGGLLFGVATFRSGILPRWAGALLAIGTMLAPVAALLPNASQPKSPCLWGWHSPGWAMRCGLNRQHKPLKPTAEKWLKASKHGAAADNTAAVNGSFSIRRLSLAADIFYAHLCLDPDPRLYRPVKRANYILDTGRDTAVGLGSLAPDDQSDPLVCRGPL